MSQLSRAQVKTYFETGDYPTQDQFSSFIDSTVWYDENTPSDIDQLYTLLGYAGKGETIGTNAFRLGGSLTMVDQQIRFSPLKISVSTTITGVRYGSVTAGNYTANNENRIGIYSFNVLTGLLTLVAATTNDGTLWATTSNTVGSRNLTTPWTATAGIYWSAVLYCRSVVVSAPGIASGNASLFVPVMETAFAGSNKVCMLLAAQTSLPSSVNMSALTRSGTPIWIQLY